MGPATTSVKIVGPSQGDEGFLGSIGVRFLIDGIEAGDRFSLVEHPMSPRALAAPLHLHTREAEAFHLLAGTMTYRAGSRLAHLAAGDFIYLPRGVPHAFRISGDIPARFLALTVPGGRP